MGARQEIARAGLREDGNWLYRLDADGAFEAWYSANRQSITITSASGNLYRSEARTLTLPTAITGLGTVAVKHAVVNAAHSNYPAWGMLASITATGVTYYAASGGSRSNSPNYTVTAHVVGRVTADE